MKKIFLPLILVTSVIAILGFSNKTFKLHTEDKTQYRYVLSVPKTMSFQQFVGFLSKNNFDIAGVNLHQQTVEVITDDFGLSEIKKNNLLGFIRAQETVGRSISLPDPQYFNPASLEKKLKELNAQFPDITRLEQIGTSLQGRPIWALLVSSDANNESALQTKPSILMDGMHHAREVMTPEIVEGIAENMIQILTDTSSDLHVTAQRWNFWFVPMLNVDGNNIVWTKDAWWRKNARSNGANIFGVDINRNYKYKWGACNGSSGSQSSETYRGASGNSENESSALNELAAKIRPSAYVSYHSYGELILYPHGCTNKLATEDALFSKIAKELQAVLPSDSPGQSYSPGTPWQILYGVDGDSMSHMYAEYGSLAYTYEVNNSFQPSYNLKKATLEKHLGAFKYLLNRMEKNLLSLKVTNAETKEAIVAEIAISSIEQKNGESPFKTNKAGFFYKVLDPGTYQVKVQDQNGKSKTINVQMNGSAAFEIEI